MTAPERFAEKSDSLLHRGLLPQKARFEYGEKYQTALISKNFPTSNLSPIAVATVAKLPAKILLVGGPERSGTLRRINDLSKVRVDMASLNAQADF
jgi:hypothetical protein